MKECCATDAGPRIVFFTGGSALRGVSRKVAQHTKNAVHLVTPFDSGGSTAELRRCFAMPAVGDLRNRIMALADRKRVPYALLELLSHRFAVDTENRYLRRRITALATGSDPLVTDLSPILREICSRHFTYFQEKIPEDFDLRGASLGNLFIAGGYLHNGRDLLSVLALLSRLCATRGTVLPVVEADLHLAALLQNGTTLVGEHLLSSTDMRNTASPISRLFLTDASPYAKTATEVIPSASENILEHIRTADLICFPMGSFYSSIMASILPKGVGKAVTVATCPKVYVPNVGSDHEERGLTTQDRIHVLLDTLKRDAGQVPIHSLLTHVFMDQTHSADPTLFPNVHFRRTRLTSPQAKENHDACRVATELLNLARVARSQRESRESICA